MSTKEHHGPGSNGAPVHADVTFERFDAEDLNLDQILRSDPIVVGGRLPDR